MERLLIVEDDVELCGLLAERFGSDGFSLEAVHDGARGLERALSGEHSLVILDLMLPHLGGLEVLRKLRAQSGIPVLILTARGEDVDRILGLEIGADDYLPKPFNPRELLARVRAILRRASPARSDGERLTAGDITLDTAAREAWINGRQVNLTSVEFSLLEEFMRHAGHVVTRDDLTQSVLGRKLGAFDRVIDVHVSNLRKKLTGGSAGERIKAVRGAGYQFVVRSETKKT
jgi:two-component system response regulator CpxR